MASNPVWEICERMAEVQALLLRCLLFSSEHAAG
jgi:hypothetical protein